MRAALPLAHLLPVWSAGTDDPAGGDGRSGAQGVTTERGDVTSHGDVELDAPTTTARGQGQRDSHEGEHRTSRTIAAPFVRTKRRTTFASGVTVGPRGRGGDVVANRHESDGAA